MTRAYSPEANLSATERSVLGSLNKVWPSATIMTPTSLGTNDTVDNPLLFVDAVQTLSDNGMLLYEAFLTGQASGPRFLDTMITARGKAALNAVESGA
ncbi:hypothetical protein AB1K62_07800 [Parasphingorhabdus sp. JC815]|uniref:hypothetical protein n=1 Tax=Parasphingorhabdus sp. JC815 TaxID=3232140 RepID=UPI003457CC60